MVIRGDLLSVDLSNVFQMLAMNRKRGVLTIQNRENILETRCLVLDADRVGLLDVPKNQDLAAILVDLGILDYGEWREAQTKAKQFGVRPADYIAKRGLIKKEDLERAETRLQEELILEIFLWKNVAFSLDEESRPHEVSERRLFTLDLMVMEAARRQDEWMRVLETIEGGREIWSIDSPVEDPDLSPTDRIVADHLDGILGTREIMAATGLPRYQVDSSIGRLVDGGHARRMELDDLIAAGDRLGAAGHKDESIRLYQAAVRKDRRSIGLHKRLAAAYFDVGRVAKAAAHYKFCAMMLLDSGHVRESLSIYQYVVSILPTDFRAIETAVSLIARLGGPASSEDRRTIEQADELCQFYHDSKLYDRAEDVLTELIKIAPKDNGYGFMMARLQSKAGRIDDAVETYLRLAGRLQDLNDLDGALNVYKMLGGIDASCRDLCARKSAAIRLIMDRRTRRRVSAMAVLVATGLIALGAVGYWLFGRAATDEYAAIQSEWDAATTEEDWMRLSRAFSELAEQYPLTGAADRARESARIADARAESLRRAARDVAETERARKLELLYRAGLAFREADGLQQALDLEGALQAYERALELAEEGGHAAWAEQGDRQLSARIADLRSHIAEERRLLAEIDTLTIEGRHQEVFALARSMLDPSRGGLDHEAMRVLSRSTRRALRFPFQLRVAPEDADVVIDDVPASAPRLIQLGGGRAQARIQVSKPGYSPRRLDLVEEDRSHAQLVVLDRRPQATLASGSRVAAIDGSGDDLIVVGVDGVTRFFVGGPTGSPVIERPDGLVTVSADPVFTPEFVFMGCSDGRVRAVDRRSRQLAWAKQPAFGAVRALAVCGDRVAAVSGGDGRRLTLLDRATGVELGFVDLTARVSVLAAVGDDLVAVVESGELDFVDVGGLRVRSTASGPFRPVLAVPNGNVAVLSADGGTLFVYSSKGEMQVGGDRPLERPLRAGPFALGDRLFGFAADGALWTLGPDRTPRLSDRTAGRDLEASLSSMRAVDAERALISVGDGRHLLVDVARGVVVDAIKSATGLAAVVGEWRGSSLLGAADVDGTIEIFGN